VALVIVVVVEDKAELPITRTNMTPGVQTAEIKDRGVALILHPLDCCASHLHDQLDKLISHADHRRFTLFISPSSNHGTHNT
jgi:hypothetical protein